MTRNIVIDKNGKIAFLTRLFDKEEFQTMINKIDLLIQEQYQSTPFKRDS